MKIHSLPSLYQITPEPLDPPDFEGFLAQLNCTLELGIKLVQLRAKHLERRDHLQLAQWALRICRAHGALLVFNGSVEMALEVGSDGVHLNSQALMSCKGRPAPENILVSAACHNAAQISHAERIGADFVTLSPVLPTKTHPEAEPMGWKCFGEIVSGSKIPVFALGGMRPELIGKAKEAGAWGVAAISATWCESSSIQ